MNNNIDDLITRIEEGFNNLRKRTDFNSLLFRDQLWVLETALEKAKSAQKQDALNHMWDFFKRTASRVLEGSDANNNSIWDANIQVEGQMTTLGELFLELKEIVKKS